MEDLVVQIKNPQWRFSVILAVVVLIGAYYGITDSDITSWGIFFSTLNTAVLNPYVVFSMLVSVWNAVIDPTTSDFRQCECSYIRKAEKIKNETGCRYGSLFFVCSFYVVCAIIILF